MANGCNQCCAIILFMVGTGTGLLGIAFISGFAGITASVMDSTLAFEPLPAPCSISNVTHSRVTTDDGDNCNDRITYEFCVPVDEAPTQFGNCGCELMGEQFCNYDFGSSGNCEPCSNMDGSRARCRLDGLPARGAADCEHYCFDSLESPGPTFGKVSPGCYKSREFDERVCETSCDRCREPPRFEFEFGARYDCWQPQAGARIDWPYSCGNGPCYKLADPSAEYNIAVVVATVLLVFGLIAMVCCLSCCSVACCCSKGAKRDPPPAPAGATSSSTQPQVVVHAQAAVPMPAYPQAAYPQQPVAMAQPCTGVQMVTPMAMAQPVMAVAVAMPAESKV